MTLHWWMHWFWVTAQLAVILASPLPSTTEDPKRRFGPSENSTEGSKIKMQLPTTTTTTLNPHREIDDSPIRARPNDRENLETSTIANFRIAKAIDFYDSPSRSKIAASNRSPGFDDTTRISEAPPVGDDSDDVARIDAKPSNERNRNGNPTRIRTQSPGTVVTRFQVPNATVLGYPTSKRDSRITWVVTTGRPNYRRRIEKTTADDAIRNFSGIGPNEDKDLSVLPLRVEAARFKLVVNRTRTIIANNADGTSTRTFNGSEDIEIDQELAEPRLAATAASILQGAISDSTRLSRARNTFSSDFQIGRDDERSSEIDESEIIVEDVNAEIEGSTTSAIDIAAIAGSCLATVVLLGTMASIGFIMYRRKYLNPPQTLNSDKCSNPDSSGYIDDSTIRDNSEEMYSLDNDSFLNSLEAMTIQNYWTDSVKHTKL